MNAWKVILATLVIFIAGVLTGALLVTSTVKLENTLHPTPAPVAEQVIVRPGKTNRPPNAFNNPNNPNALAANPWQLRNRELMRRMDRELDLTPEQRQKIETIIATGQDRMRQIWKPIAPQMNHEAQFVNSQIRELLTPEQQAKFDEIAKAHPQGSRKGMSNSPLATNTISTNAPVLP